MACRSQSWPFVGSLEVPQSPRLTRLTPESCNNLGCNIAPVLRHCLLLAPGGCRRSWRGGGWTPSGTRSRARRSWWTGCRWGQEHWTTRETQTLGPVVFLFVCVRD